MGIFAAERLETINMRFGFQAGDQVLQALSHHIAQQSLAGISCFAGAGRALWYWCRDAFPKLT